MSILAPNGHVIVPNSGPCPTVRVVSPEAPDGFKVINESDLTAEHEIWSEGGKPESSANAARPVLSLNSPSDTKKNR